MSHEVEKEVREEWFKGKELMEVMLEVSNDVQYTM